MLSFVIPTNRPQFLERLLQYYRLLTVAEPIHIADSSIEHSILRVPTSETSMPRNVMYHTFPPDIGFPDKLTKVIDQIKTPFTTLVADDDFIIPASALRAAHFLEEHEDYSVVHGEAIIFELISGLVHGRMRGIARYPQRSIEHDTAAERLVDHLSSYASTCYSVHRREQLHENWRLAKTLSTDSHLVELLPSCLSVIQGKIKKLEGLHLVRQLHQERESHRFGRQGDFFDWITKPDWPILYAEFRDCLTEALAHQDGLAFERAREIVKQAFWAYLQRGLSQKYQQRYGSPSTMVNVKAVLKRIYGAKSAWRFIQSLRISPEHISLSSLLNPRSPYHQDFMPIYRVITSSPEMI